MDPCAQPTRESLNAYNKLMPASTVRVNRGNIYDDRLCYWLIVLDFDIKQITIVYPERVMALFKKAKIECSVVVCHNCFDK